MSTVHRLLLLRHAKSRWDQPNVVDHDRRLAPRGRRAASALHDHLLGQTAGPDLVLCSSAARAVETLERIRPALPPGAAIEIEQSLYAADATDLLVRIHHVPEAIGCVLLIGHNPAIGDLAVMLIGHGDRASRAAMAVKFPTAALARLSINRRWSDVEAGGADLEEFWTPR
jgi:phosphohistidine phosphatase